jgi:hypothetical protein
LSVAAGASPKESSKRWWMWDMHNQYKAFFPKSLRVSMNMALSESDKANITAREFLQKQFAHKYEPTASLDSTNNKVVDCDGVITVVDATL